MSPPLCAIPAATIRQFQPNPSWFVRSPQGIHGIGHETRVLIWTQVLAAISPADKSPVDAAVLGWAAAIHDTRRQDDGIDPRHGSRAADWLTAHPDVLPPPVPIARVKYLCRWHAPVDEAAPEMTAELAIFKDADALDRWRIADLDPSFLRTPTAYALLDTSFAICEQTAFRSRGDDTFECVVSAAIAMGILT